MNSGKLFFTKRLFVRLAIEGDADLYYQLWTDPKVMAMVGFPNGMRVTKIGIQARLTNNSGDGFGQLLVIGLSQTDESIGEAWLGKVDENKVTEPDVKLLPAFWGHNYGAEVWKGIVNYIFTHSDCQIIKSTPNVQNIASIKMQEAAGGVRVGEGVLHFSESPQGQIESLKYYEYRTTRQIG
jgi:RimJ/RimL family protein N-acetyltransferase